MRISNPPQDRPGNTSRAFKIPLEVNLWLTRGWVIVPTERKGVVLLGQKSMRKRDKVLLGLGVIALGLFAAGFYSIGLAGFLLIALASLDYWRNTQPPSKFFPVDGESTRSLER